MCRGRWKPGLAHSGKGAPCSIFLWFHDTYRLLTCCVTFSCITFIRLCPCPGAGSPATLAHEDATMTWTTEVVGVFLCPWWRVRYGGVWGGTRPWRAPTARLKTRGSQPVGSETPLGVLNGQRQRVDLGSVCEGPEAEGQVRRLGNWALVTSDRNPGQARLSNKGSEMPGASLALGTAVPQGPLAWQQDGWGPTGASGPMEARPGEAHGWAVLDHGHSTTFYWPRQTPRSARVQVGKQ